MASIPKISYLWSVEFEIIALGDQGPDYSNIIHVTNGENYGSPGNRYPAVFVQKGRQQLIINSYVNGHHNYDYQTPNDISRDEWTKITIEQIARDSKIVYRIEINGETVQEVENTTPTEFHDMKFYAADPWHKQQANANLRNVIYRRYPTCNLTYCIFSEFCT